MIGSSHLVSTTQPNGRVDLRIPDEVGNLFRTVDRSDREFGLTGELKEDRTAEGGTRTYAYDSEGNLVRREDPDGGVWSYSWEGTGRLAKVVCPNEEEITFEYDALGRRVSKTAEYKIIKWIWDRGNVANEVAAYSSDTSDTDVVTWVFDPEGFSPVARVDATSVHSIVTDHLGTPICTLNDDIATCWSVSPSGRTEGEISADSSLCPWRFPGQYEDQETGLYYSRFRYYDPLQQTYICHDPIGLHGGPCLRAYVVDPLVSTDPFALSVRKDYESSSLYSRNFFRSMSRAEAAAVGETSLLRGGRPGETFFTDQRIRSPARTQDRLSLPSRPDVQVEFRIVDNLELKRRGTRVQPDYGGREDPVRVEVINVQPF